MLLDQKLLAMQSPQLDPGSQCGYEVFPLLWPHCCDSLTKRPVHLKFHSPYRGQKTILQEAGGKDNSAQPQLQADPKGKDYRTQTSKLQGV